MMKDGIQTGDGSNRYINCTTKSHFCTILFDYLKNISCFLLLLLSTSLFVLPSFNLVPLFLVPDSNLRDSNASDMTSGSIGNRILINRSASTFDRRSTHPSALSVFVALCLFPSLCHYLSVLSLSISWFLSILNCLYLVLSISCIVYYVIVCIMLRM